jgi:hypothetical protein
MPAKNNGMEVSIKELFCLKRMIARLIRATVIISFPLSIASTNGGDASNNHKNIL